MSTPFRAWSLPTLIFVALLAGSLGSSAAATEPSSSQEQSGPAKLLASADTIVVMPDEQEVSLKAAVALMEEGYKLIKMSISSSERAILYRDLSDLEGVLPTQALERMQSSGGERPESSRIGEMFPDFEFSDLEGNHWTQENLQGQIVVFNFWFMACAPCIQEIPALNRLTERFGEGVVFLAPSFDPEPSLEKFLVEQPFHYKVSSVAHPVLAKFGIAGFPTHVVLDKEGKIAKVIVGLSNADALADELAETIEGLL